MRRDERVPREVLWMFSLVSFSISFPATAVSSERKFQAAEIEAAGNVFHTLGH